MKLPKITEDKANHFIYGFAIFILSTLFFADIICFTIVLAVAFAKECYDEYDYGGFDIVDLIYTITPALILTLNK